MDSNSHQKDSTLEFNDMKNIISPETLSFEIKPYISLFEPYMGKNKVFSLELMNKVLKNTKKFSAMNEKSFRRLESTALIAPSWFHNCIDVNKIEISTRILIHFFIFDDHCECDWGDGGRNQNNIKYLWNQFLDCLKKLMGEPIVGIDWEPYIWSFYATSEVIFASYNNDQKKRFVREWSLYAAGNIHEADHYDENWQSFKQMMKTRKGSIGLQASVQMIEYINDLKLTDNEWLNVNNQKMISKASKWSVLLNDYTSLRSEWNECGNNFEKMRNSISILMRIEKYDLQSAVDKVMDLIEITEKQIIDYQDKFLQQYPENTKLQMYIKSVNELLGGSWLCQHGIERYTGNPSEEGYRLEGKIEINSQHITSKHHSKESFSRFLKYE